MLIRIPKKLDLENFAFYKMQYVVPKYGQFEIITPNQLEQLYNVQRAFESMHRMFSEPWQEELLLVLLDKNRCLLTVKLLERGSLYQVEVNFSKLISSIRNFSAETGIFGKPKYVVLIHNHPSGVALPSEGDLQITTLLNDFIPEATDAILLDHIIGGRVVDLRLSEKLMTDDNFLKESSGPLTFESYITLKLKWGNKYPKAFFESNKYGFYFFSKHGLCPGVGM